MNKKNKCPLCNNKDIKSFFADKNRIFQRCTDCELVFVPERYWLNSQDEKKIYDLHENDPLDQGYRAFLSRLSKPLFSKLNSEQKGLDFGCGPGPTLSSLFEQQGLQPMDIYDPYYHSDPSVFKKKYDFICATEVVEHLRNPNEDFSTLFNILRRGGWLGIMTKMVINEKAFRQWNYIRDMTHICFYSRNTFKYIAQRFHAELDFVSNDVILLKKR
jgi:2-polyprenyl-3-methyl-5-hydroxy-6-metoxy-1,4-benzoquinol methylase